MKMYCVINYSIIIYVANNKKCKNIYAPTYYLDYLPIAPEDNIGT